MSGWHTVEGTDSAGQTLQLVSAARPVSGARDAAAQPILFGTPGDVFTDDNVTNPANGFVLSSGGIGTESYLAANAIDASYLKADALINDKWRFAGGVRKLSHH